jgi:hypothetical protein
MGDSHGEAKPMKITELNWRTSDDGETWVLGGRVLDPGNRGLLDIRRKLFQIQYLGRGRGPRGLMRWKVYDKRYWVDDPQDIPEFLDLDEAKAWVLTIITLEN